jgi:hypothetical protein
MGNSESLDTPEITSNDKKMLKEKVVNSRIESINNAQKSIIQDVDITSHEDLVKTILFTETAKTQLKKGGSALTKTDLISIIIMVDISKLNNLEYLKTLTVNDLNTIIRSIIYDTNRYKSNNLITNGSNNGTNYSSNTLNNNVIVQEEDISSKKLEITNNKQKSSKKLEIMNNTDISFNEILLLEDKPIKKSTTRKAK